MVSLAVGAHQYDTGASVRETPWQVRCRVRDTGSNRPDRAMRQDAQVNPLLLPHEAALPPDPDRLPVMTPHPVMRRSTFCEPHAGHRLPSPAA